MPEQKSIVGADITASNYKAPYETVTFVFGVKGLQLNNAIDKLNPGELSRLTNFVHTSGGQMVLRPGLTVLATGGTNQHSVARLNDPENSDATRVWGIDSSVYVGLSGALSQIESGFSGDPLHLVADRVPQSGESWMFIGDSAKMRKVRHDGLIIPIGLPAPAVHAVPALVTAQIKNVCAFGTSDGTDAPHWTGTAGVDRSTPPITTGIPTVLNDSTPTSLAADLFVTNAPPANKAFNSWWGIAKSLDLSVFPNGNAIVDEDIVHVWMKVNDPSMVEEVRIYLVCSPSFDATKLPGMSGPNTDFFVKSWTNNDFTTFIQAQGSFQDSANTARTRYILNSGVNTNSIFNGAIPGKTAALPDDSFQPVELAAGQQQWTEFGVIGLPVRRGDFLRSGNATTRGWNTITGIIIYAQTARLGALAIGIGNMTITGGDGLDSSDTTDAMYDWKYTNFDPRTGAESNGSPIQVGSGTIGANSTTLTLSASLFNVLDVGALIEVAGAGPQASKLSTSIKSYTSGTVVQLNSAASTAVSGARVEWDATSAKINAIRQRANVTPAAYGNAAIRQRFYRRGGTVVDDWHFVGMNSADGAALADGEADDVMAASDVIPTDNFQPVPSIADNGDAILAQPVRSLWGPVAGLLFACGDPNRPGDLYYSFPGQPDHWGAENRVEVCSPSDELMSGLVYGGQSFVFSRERLYVLYPNLSGDLNVTATPTACRKGLINPWAYCIGPSGINFVYNDGVYLTGGGNPELYSQDIGPLFQPGTSPINGYYPIDIVNHVNAIRLSCHDNDVHLFYIDTNGDKQELIYSIIYKYWRHAHYEQPINVGQHDDANFIPVMVMLGSAGTAYTLGGASDGGTAIPWNARTGCVDFGRPREDKQLGDIVVDMDRGGVSAVVTAYLNNENLVDTAQTISGGSGRARYIFQPFGTTPQGAINVGVDIAGTGGSPILYQTAVSVIPLPDTVINRATQWDDLNIAEEKYLTGVMLEADTAGVDKTIVIEGDIGGTYVTVATLTLNSNGRHKQWFTWPAVHVNMFRIQPDTNSPDCVAWRLFKADWLAQVEPPRIAGWDTNWETFGDTYYTGLDLDCDTFGATKVIEVFVDQTLIGTFNVVANGRRYIHLTFGPGRGHIYRFVATDANPGLLYMHKWYLDQEPSEQTNWNQNLTTWNTLTDKYLKGLTIESDTFGQTKTVHVEVDGVVQETILVNTNGRLVTNYTFPQVKGRIFRVLPVDNFPSRLYTIQPIFDQEPLGLKRWETQQVDHSIPGWQVPLYSYVSLRSSADVTMTLEVTTQNGVNAPTTVQTYALPSTGGTKQKVFVPFQPIKGVLFKYVFTSDEEFWLYQEETNVFIRAWGGSEPHEVHPFGNSDLDAPRNMVSATLSAAKQGGGNNVA